MVRRSHTPAGPLAFVALGLFVLTWASLRLWRSPESEQPQAVTPAQTIAQPAAVSAHVAISVATNVSPEPEVVVATPTAPPLPATPAALALDQFSTLPAVAELAPPVATRVEFDPVVTLEPDVELMLAPALSPASNVNLPAMEIRREIAPQGQQSQVARAQLARAPQLDRAWPYPVMLVTDLNILAQQTATQTWASEVLIHLDALFAVEELDSPAASMVLERLERLSDAAKNVAPQCRDQEERALLARSSFGLTRRLIIWRHVMELSQASFVVGADTPHDDQRVAKAVAAAETFFTSTPSWSDYLLLRRIRGALVLSTRSERGDLARRVLERLEASHLTKEQKKLLSQTPVLELASAVKPWAAEPIDSARLLDALEQLEVGHASTAAQAVAAAYQRLRWSDDKPASELADDLDTYYRNANVRVAI
ncbi:MAG TPA: hypothetical protein VL096_01275, partial [Pirellulaceae bacterium]|nr:hypothetical protein [Pirellulaceae bacterium]